LETGAEYRIQTYRQFNRSTKLVEAFHHVGQDCRSRGMTDQNDGPHPSAPVVRGNFVRERRPTEIIDDGDRNALRLQLGCDVIQT